MKVNTGKSHLLISGNSRTNTMIDNTYIESEDEQVLLGITIDWLLKETGKLILNWFFLFIVTYTEARNNREVFCNFSI